MKTTEQKVEVLQKQVKELQSCLMHLLESMERTTLLPKAYDDVCGDHVARDERLKELNCKSCEGITDISGMPCDQCIEKMPKNKYQAALTRVNARIDELNDGWVPDWDSFVCYIACSANGRYWFELSDRFIPSVCGPIKTSTSCFTIIAEHKKDLDIIFNYHK